MTRKTGETGERIALKYLKRQGMKIREKNYRAVRGEIDIIAEDDGVLVFVEVKTNRADGSVAPEVRVDLKKQRQIGKIARAYLQENGIDSMDCRFDVVGVTLCEDGTRDIAHFRNAFWLPRDV